nr:acyl-CoA dehydrogenase family protein [Micromonospora sp. DSM 115978]
MQFRLDSEQLAVRDAVRAFCADRLDLAGVAGREGKPADTELWQGMAELGVLGILADEPGRAAGGQDVAACEDPGDGVGVVEAAIAFEQLGAHLITGPVLWSVLAAP